MPQHGLLRPMSGEPPQRRPKLADLGLQVADPTLQRSDGPGLEIGGIWGGR